MANYNKQATPVKDSSRFATITIYLTTFVVGILLLVYAPNILMAIGKIAGCVVLTAMAVVPMIYTLTYDNGYDE